MSDRSAEKLIDRALTDPKGLNNKIAMDEDAKSELIKISINLYLFFSVSYANILEKMAREIGIEFSKITNILKNDKRIGMHAYINPSLGMSGGNLERDSFFFNKLNLYFGNANDLFDIDKIFEAIETT